MAVIPFPMDLAPQGPSPRMSWQLRSLTARHVSPLSGVATTLERPGAHWAASLSYENLGAARRGRLQAFAAACRGHGSRFHMPVFGWTRRGSFPATELFTNNLFEDGTTGWTAQSSTLTAADGLLRVSPSVTGNNPGAFQSLTLAAYTPYALRGLLLSSGFPYATPAIYTEDAGGVSVSTTGFGLRTVVLVPGTAGAAPSYCGYISDASGFLPQHYLEIGYSSMARCALVDNGPNRLMQSDELDATWTTVEASVDDQAIAAPDRTTTADSIIESAAAASGHYVTQSATVASAAADYAFCCALRAGTRTRMTLLIREATGSSDVSANFNLNTGAVATSSAGANWANARAVIRSLGDGWYYCAVVGRKTNAATTLNCHIRLTDASGNTVYNGDGSSNAYAWRATLAQSSVPVRLTATTTTAVASGTSQTGSALYLKGLPASTAGLLLQGDPVEIIIGTTSQLVRARATLNSDAAGLGYLEFEPPLRVSPSDGAAVIVENPLCKMMLDSNNAGWTDRQIGLADLELACVEDTYPS